MPNWWDNIQNGLGQAYMPNYGSLDPNAQQQANQQAMMQLGAGLLANSTKRPGEALGRSLGGLQQAGTQAMQAQAMAETMNDRRDERNKKQRRLQALGQFMMAPGIQQGMPEGFAGLAQQDPETAFSIWSESRKGQDPTDAIQNWQYAQSLPAEQRKSFLESKGGQKIEVNTGNQSTLEGELVGTLGKDMGKAWAGTIAQGQKAGSMQRDMELLDELIKVAPQGPLQGRLAERFPGFSSAGSAFESVVKRLAPQTRAEGSGSTSDIEYEGMLKSLPALRNNPEANALISGAVKRKAQIDQMAAAEVNKYMTGQQDFVTTQQNLQQLSQASIMTPELQSLIRGVGPQGDADILNQADAIVGN